MRGGICSKLPVQGVAYGRHLSQVRGRAEFRGYAQEAICLGSSERRTREKLSQDEGEPFPPTHSRTLVTSFFFSASPAAGTGSERAAVLAAALATYIHDTVCIAIVVALHMC